MECIEEESWLMLLPNEIKSAILGFLRPRDILACSRVCREWHVLCNDPYLWKVYVDRKAERPWREETLNVEKSDEEEAKMELIEVKMLKIQAAREHFELTLNRRIEERDKKLFCIKKKESNAAQTLARNIKTKDKIKDIGAIASIIMVVLLFWNYFSIFGIPIGITLGAVLGQFVRKITEEVFQPTIRNSNQRSSLLSQRRKVVEIDWYLELDRIKMQQDTLKSLYDREYVKAEQLEQKITSRWRSFKRAIMPQAKPQPQKETKEKYGRWCLIS